MGDENEEPHPALYEGRFRDNHGHVVTLRVGVPARKTGKSWLCALHIQGYGNNPTKQIVGADPLQALVLALEHARRLLYPLNLTEEKGGSPLEMVLPEFIPIGYGLEFRNFLSALVQCEVAKQELAISEKWRDKQKRRRQ
jgi:hypothetical protein